MTTDEIPTEALQAAVEAAATAWYATYQHDPATYPDGRYPLRQAILAAAPHLIAEGRRQAAAEIRMADPGLGWSVLSPERAARIAEGGSSMTGPTPEWSPDREQWYRRRVSALEALLAHHRVGKTPSEKLFTELAATRRRIASDGTWLGAP